MIGGRGKQLWVLVVGDDMGAALELFRLVERGGHHATVSTHAAAPGLLGADEFDAVLVDARRSGTAEIADTLGAVEQEARRRAIPHHRIAADGDVAVALRQG